MQVFRGVVQNIPQGMAKRLLVAAMLAVLLWGLVAGMLMIPTMAQDGPPAALLKAVTDFLSQKTGKSVGLLDNYTFQGATYPDSALGCPQTGKTYPPGPIQAYKFLVTIKGIIYDVRTTQDGTLIVLCSGADVKQSGALLTYHSAQFNIGYPDSWGYTKRDNDVFFGLGPSPVCAQPGMSVTTLGKVDSTETPDSLLKQYIQLTANGKFDTTSVPIKNSGLSILYTAPCTDGSPRQARVTVFIAYGYAFRVVQFVPLNGFSQWDDQFMQILNGFTPATSEGGGASGQAVEPIADEPLALVGHIFAGNIYFGTLDDMPGLPVTTDASGSHTYRDPVVSPDGNYIAFVSSDTGSLYVATAKLGNAPVKLTVGASAPIAWSPNGTEIAYITGPDQADAKTNQIMAARIDGSGTRKIGDTQAVTARGCGLSPDGDPADPVYWNEAGFDGNPYLLNWSQTGTLYYSLGCDGVGIGQISDQGTDGKVVNPNLRRAQLSPDGTEFVGVLKGDNGDNLVRLRLSDQSLTTLKSATPDQVAWSVDGKAIYYSSIAVKNIVTLDTPTDQDRGSKLFGAWPVNIGVYDVTLHRLDLVTNQDIEAFQADGRGIGRIVPSPDGTGVLFSFIQSGAALAEAFKNNASDAELNRQTPITQLYWHALAVPTNALVAISSYPSWGPINAALAPTPTGGNTATPGGIGRPFVPGPLATRVPVSGTPAGTRPRAAPPTNTKAAPPGTTVG